MEPIKVTFLGTSSAVPTKNRNHSAVLLEYRNEMILVDCGEGTQRQFAYAKKNMQRLTRILITHWHGDHIIGLPGLLQTLFMNNYPKTLHLYGPKGTVQWFERLRPFCGTNLINIKIHEVNEGFFINEKDFCIEAKEMQHGIPSLAYAFVIKEKHRLDKKKIKKLKLPNNHLLGKLQAGQDIVWKGKKISAKSVSYVEKEKRVTIIMDTQYNNKAVEIAKNSDLLLAESSFMDSEKDKAAEYKHMTDKEAATIAKKAKAKKLALTHLSQRYQHNTSPMLKEARSVFKNTIIPNDLDSVII
jgi:ribonuclease Z